MPFLYVYVHNFCTYVVCIFLWAKRVLILLFIMPSVKINEPRLGIYYMCRASTNRNMLTYYLYRVECVTMVIRKDNILLGRVSVYTIMRLSRASVMYCYGFQVFRCKYYHIFIMQYECIEMNLIVCYGLLADLS